MKFQKRILKDGATAFNEHLRKIEPCRKSVHITIKGKERKKRAKTFPNNSYSKSKYNSTEVVSFIIHNTLLRLRKDRDRLLLV